MREGTFKMCKESRIKRYVGTQSIGMIKAKERSVGLSIQVKTRTACFVFN